SVAGWRWQGRCSIRSSITRSSTGLARCGWKTGTFSRNWKGSPWILPGYLECAGLEHFGRSGRRQLHQFDFVTIGIQEDPDFDAAHVEHGDDRIGARSHSPGEHGVDVFGHEANR